jgi:hypothetical protein
MKINLNLLTLYVILIFNLSIQAQRNHQVSQSGVLEGIVRTVIVEDDKATKRHFLDTGNQLFALKLESEDLVNAKVSVTGRFDAEHTLVPTKIKVLDVAKAASNFPVSGTRKVLVLLLNFQNNASQPVSAAEVKNKIFTDAKSPNHYYQQVSGNRMRLGGIQSAEGDVAGYFTLPYTNEGCNIYEWTPAADQIAASHGINVNLYQSVIYLFAGNEPDCSFASASLGVIGDLETTNRVFFRNAFSDFNWQNFQYYIAHELGHNLGLYHINGYNNCPWIVPLESCTDFVEYADRSDVMGSFGYHLLSNYHRWQLGWLNGQIKTFDTAGVYYVNLHSPSHPTKQTTMAQIRIKDANGHLTGQSFYLEYRRNLPPFDIFASGDFPNPPLQLAEKGVTIRLAGTNNPLAVSRYYIIDTTPLTNDFGDAALPPGGTYTNTFYGVSISTISVNPFFGARVKIQLTR